jgi:hypothetical protein
LTVNNVRNRFFPQKDDGRFSKISGGKVLSSRTAKKQNLAAKAFRQAANAFGNCKEHSLKPFCGLIALFNAS